MDVYEKMFSVEQSIHIVRQFVSFVEREKESYVYIIYNIKSGCIKALIVHYILYRYNCTIWDTRHNRCDHLYDCTAVV